MYTNMSLPVEGEKHVEKKRIITNKEEGEKICRGDTGGGKKNEKKREYSIRTEGGGRKNVEKSG